MPAPVLLTDDQFTTFSIRERLDEIDVFLDNGAIPVAGWQGVSDERDALNALLWEAYGVFNIDENDGELLFTSEEFAARVDVSGALGTVTVEGQTFYVSFVED